MTDPHAYPNPDILVSVDWLAQRLNDPSVKIIDGRSGRDYAAGHIPGAIVLPTPLFKAAGSAETCSPDDFAATVGAAGIRPTDTVVTYDSNSPTGARIWWAFTRFGHPNVRYLHGGMIQWLQAGQPVATESVSPPPVDYTLAGDRADYACTLPQAISALDRPNVLYWDTRSLGEYTGEDPRNNPAERAGHIPGAVQLEWRELVDEATGFFKPAAEMRQLLQTAGITPEQEVVAY